MKVYILAITEGTWMFPVGSGKSINQKQLLIKHLKNTKKENGGGTNAKILVADNWHEEGERN